MKITYPNGTEKISFGEHYFNGKITSCIFSEAYIKSLGITMQNQFGGHLNGTKKDCLKYYFEIIRKRKP